MRGEHPQAKNLRVLLLGELPGARVSGVKPIPAQSPAPGIAAEDCGLIKFYNEN